MTKTQIESRLLRMIVSKTVVYYKVTIYRLEFLFYIFNSISIH